MPRARHNHTHGRHRPPRDTSNAQVEISAGGIVFKRTQRGVRIAFILDPFGKWAFAKGHVEEGETIIEAAIRETREEMGIHDLTVVAPLGTIDFWFRERYRKENRGATIHKYVHYFLMEAPAYVKGRPQRKERIRKIIWVGLRRLSHTSSYDDVRPILERVMEYFSKDRAAIQEGFASGVNGEVTMPQIGPELGKEPGLPAQTFSPSSKPPVATPKPAPWRFPPRPRVDPRRPKIDIDGDLGEPLKL